ncbi:hypothetical protein [Polynucleobacter necessarius]|uniref:hypothetical protein n=1 Tax=Polynucleobacter necessarius TaxID=576610 RepID=UPI001E440D52|nr:hypothetical protein [Polynucleobacter necessarius]
MKAKMVSQSVTARAFPGFVKDGFDPFMVESSGNLTYDIPNLEMTNVSLRVQVFGLDIGVR